MRGKGDWWWSGRSALPIHRLEHQDGDSVGRGRCGGGGAARRCECRTRLVSRRDETHHIRQVPSNWTGGRAVRCAAAGPHADTSVEESVLIGVSVTVLFFPGV